MTLGTLVPRTSAEILEHLGSVPLSEAVLCVSCDVIRSYKVQTCACGSQQAVPVKRGYFHRQPRLSRQARVRRVDRPTWERLEKIRAHRRGNDVLGLTWSEDADALDALVVELMRKNAACGGGR